MPHFIAGGNKILLAAGKDLQPFFNMFAVHKADHVMEIMESLRIGNVHPDDMKVSFQNILLSSRRTMGLVI